MKKNKKILAGALLLCAAAAIAGVVWKKMTSDEKEKKTEELPRTEVSAVHTEAVSDASAEVSQEAAVTGSAQDIEEVSENGMTQDAEQAEAETAPEIVRYPVNRTNDPVSAHVTTFFIPTAMLFSGLPGSMASAEAAAT